MKTSQLDTGKELLWKPVSEYLEGISRGKRVKIHLRIRSESPNATFMLSWTNPEGKRIRWSPSISMPTPPKKPEKDADIQSLLAIATTREVELLEGRSKVVLTQRKNNAKKAASHLYKEMEEWGKNYYVNSTSLISFRQALKRLKMAWGSNPPLLSDVSRDDMVKYRKWLLDKKHHQAYAHQLLEKIKVFFNWHYKEGHIERTPCVGITIPKPDSVIIYLKYDEIKAISSASVEDIREWAKTNVIESDIKGAGYLRNIDERSFENVKQAFLFACYTGMRISDLKALKRDAFADGDVKQITQIKTKYNYLVALGPTSKAIVEKVESMNPKEVTILFNLPRSVDVTRVLRGLAGIANINGKKMEFRIARRTFASLLVQNKVDLFQASKMLGHSNTGVTQKYYAALDPKSSIEAIAKLPQL